MPLSRNSAQPLDIQTLGTTLRLIGGRRCSRLRNSPAWPEWRHDWPGVLGHPKKRSSRCISRSHCVRVQPCKADRNTPNYLFLLFVWPPQNRPLAVATSTALDSLHISCPLRTSAGGFSCHTRL